MGNEIGLCSLRSIEEMYNQVTAEVQNHVPKLVAAAILWREARTWIDNQADLLYSQAKQLTEKDRWSDAAGQQFMIRVVRDVTVMRTWNDPMGMATSILNSGFPVPQSPAGPDVLNSLYGLVDALWAAHREVEKLRNHYNGLSEEDKNKQIHDVEARIIDQINALAPKYRDAALGLRKAVGRDWEGPRAATSSQGTPGPATNKGPGTPTAAPSPSPSPSPTDPQPADPGTQPEDSPTPTDPIKDALEAAPGALDALSQVMQSAQQLMGGGTDSPSPLPLTPSDPGNLGSLTPEEVAARLAQLGGGAPDDAGSPSLAGSGASPIGGPLGGAGAGISPLAPVNPSPPGSVGNAALPAVASFATAGSAGASASGGQGAMPPAQQQPQHGGAKTAGGIKPGAAEHAATGRSRDRKSTGTPGVSLLGRSGQGRQAKRAAEPAPAPRRWDAENDTVQLLDEELWQVKQEDTGPRYRAGQ